jgi:hypothetical protein
LEFTLWLMENKSEQYEYLVGFIKQRS